MDNYQYELVEKLSFLRFGGDEDELRAASMLCDEIRRLGGECEIEEFSIPAYKFGRYSVKVTAPYEKELDALPWGLSGSLKEGGADLKLFYAEDCSEAALYGMNDLTGYAVLVDELRLEQYKRLCERGASAILVISGKWYDTPETSDLLQRHMRPPFLNVGRIPTFFVWACDAAEMVKCEAETLHIELSEEEQEHISRNVTAVVRGREREDESVVITAHYDSVTVGKGSWDNATGSATAMYIYRYFLSHPPKRTLRFVWCGSEEQGLLGSRAYIEAHRELVEKEIRLGFNFDMCGTTLGTNKVCVTGGDELKHYADAFCREYGINASVYADVRSSDSAPFADNGIPTIDLFRVSKTAEIHTRHDLMDTLSSRQLEKDGKFAVAFIERAANSSRMPVDRGMPDNMKEKLDKYFQRQK